MKSAKPKDRHSPPFEEKKLGEMRRLTDANDVEFGFIGANCGLLGTATGEATLACLDEGTITLLRL